MPRRSWGAIAFTVLLPIAVTFLAVSTPAGALAACCRLVKVDAETPTTQVRACEPDAQGGCGNVLFEGSLAFGASQEVCPTTPTLAYSEWDTTAAAYGPPVTARCEAGSDVEL